MPVNPYIEVADVTRPMGRFEGRLFAEGGCLFLVVRADEAAGVAEVTCRIDGRTEVVEMPLVEVARRVSSGPALILDNLNGPESARRILEQQDGWYFAAREGRMGPFDSRTAASRALARYILSMQTADDTRRAPLRSSGSRHGERDRRRQPAASGQPA